MTKFLCLLKRDFKVLSGILFPRKEAQASLDKLLLRSLPLLSAGLTLIFFIVTMVQAFLLPVAVGRILLFLGSFSCIYFFAVFILCERDLIPPKRIYGLALSMAFLVALNCLAQLSLTKNPNDIVDLIILILSLGFFILSTPRYFLSVAFLLGLLISLSLVDSFGIELSHYWMSIFFGTMFSVLLHVARKRNYLEMDRYTSALNFSQLRFKTFTDVAFEGILMYEDGRITDCNKNVTDYLEYSLEELRVLNLDDFVTPEYAELTKKYIESSSTAPFDSEVMAKDGRRVPIKMRKKFLEENGCRTTILSIRDVSDKQKAEQEWNSFLVEFQKNLLALEDKNKELEELSKELQESNANKDKFFAIIAHDLKSPFTALLGFSDFLAQDFDSLSRDEVRQFSASINKSAKSVFNLLENLLEWARMQTDGIKYEPELLKVKEVTEEMTDLFRMNAKKKNIFLEAKVSENLYCFADRNMTYAILRNIMSNALKFTPSGGRVLIEAHKADPGFVALSVQDTGRGISKETMSKLFKINEHVSSEGTEHEKGTGLGLILCKDFVEKNGGKISVTSSLSAGSVFSFTLPVQ